MSDDDSDDELDWEEWEELTEEQQVARIDAAIRRQLEEYTRQLTPAQLYAQRRRRSLERCLKARQLMKQPGWHDVFLDRLRASQLLLLKLRIERSTGVYPGNA